MSVSRNELLWLPLVLAAVFFAIACVFVYRSFYKMRIHSGS